MQNFINTTIKRLADFNFLETDNGNSRFVYRFFTFCVMRFSAFVPIIPVTFDSQVARWNENINMVKTDRVFRNEINAVFSESVLDGGFYGIWFYLITTITSLTTILPSLFQPRRNNHHSFSATSAIHSNARNSYDASAFTRATLRFFVWVSRKLLSTRDTNSLGLSALPVCSKFTNSLCSKYSVTFFRAKTTFLYPRWTNKILFSTYFARLFYYPHSPVAFPALVRTVKRHLASSLCNIERLTANLARFFDNCCRSNHFVSIKVHPIQQVSIVVQAIQAKWDAYENKNLTNCFA